jgi:hypothetical protein
MGVRARSTYCKTNIARQFGYGTAKSSEVATDFVGIAAYPCAYFYYGLVHFGFYLVGK